VNELVGIGDIRLIQGEDAMENRLTNKELELMNAYWRACNYLSVGMIYLKDNPLLKEPLQTEHVKHRLLGHWGRVRLCPSFGCI
jgi:phosphoketolase